MILVHLILTLATAGIWPVFVIIWKILNAKVGGGIILNGLIVLSLGLHK
jgi:hypothetical protein